MWAQILSVALGIWLMAAPEVMGYGAAAATLHHLLGPLAAAFGTIALWEATREVRWANLPIGLALVAAPWVLGVGSAALLNSVLTGVTLTACSLVRGRVQTRMGGGWSALWSSAPAPQGSDPSEGGTTGHRRQ